MKKRIENNEYNVILGQNVRKIRKSMKVTQEEFSEILNLNPQFISQVETGKAGLSVETIIKICNASKCSSADIFNNLIKSPSISDKYELLNERDKLIIEQMINYLLDAK